MFSQKSNKKKKEGACKKTLSFETNASSSNLRKNDLEEFDIGEFV